MFVLNDLVIPSLITLWISGSGIMCGKLSENTNKVECSIQTQDEHIRSTNSPLIEKITSEHSPVRNHEDTGAASTENQRKGSKFPPRPPDGPNYLPPRPSLHPNNISSGPPTHQVASSHFRNMSTGERPQHSTVTENPQRNNSIDPVSHLEITSTTSTVQSSSPRRDDREKEKSTDKFTFPDEAITEKSISKQEPGNFTKDSEKNNSNIIFPDDGFPLTTAISIESTSIMSNETNTTLNNRNAIDVDAVPCPEGQMRHDSGVCVEPF